MPVTNFPLFEGGIIQPAAKGERLEQLLLLLFSRLYVKPVDNDHFSHLVAKELAGKYPLISMQKLWGKKVSDLGYKKDKRKVV